MLFGALAVLAPALAGCEAGFNAPTLEYHPAAFGAYASKNGVSIANAFVLGPSPSGPEVAGGRAGVFLAISSQDGDKLVSASAPGTASAVQILGGPVSVPAVGSANLTFAEAGTIAMTVPVQPKAYEYATFSPPATPSPAATKATKKRKAKASPGSTASPTATPTP
jgi:hypothetical protein